jgi:hypothetical protein
MWFTVEDLEQVSIGQHPLASASTLAASGSKEEQQYRKEKTSLLSVTARPLA